MCNVLQVSRSGYYDWLTRKPSKRSDTNKKVMDQIRAVYKESKYRYGSPKITKVLDSKGIKVSRQRVARMMRAEGLKSIIKKRYRVLTTESNHNLSIAKNHLNRRFKVSDKSKVWVSDITYIRINRSWLYLTMIMDLYDRKIIGWSLSKTMKTIDTVVPAWRMAVRNRPITASLMFHSDRGVQYASGEFRKELKSSLITQSMSRKGNCWDNAVAENFFKILKSEMVYHKQFDNHKQARLAIFEFIEVWYNRKRIHSFLGYKTPEQYGRKKILIAA